MNNKHQENGTLTAPLIFTLPASFVILNLDRLDGTGWAAVFANTHDWERDRIRSARRLLEEPSPKDVLKRGVGRRPWR